MEPVHAHAHKHAYMNQDADENTDRQHWSKFPRFSEHEDNMRLMKGKIDLHTSDNVYMRWKVS